MAHKLDKLERFFSKKKTTATTSSLATASPRSSTGSNMSGASFSGSTQSDSSQPLFPPPSFIRPKASRMLARVETTHVPKHNTQLRGPPPTQRSSERLSSGDESEARGLDYQSANSSTSSLRIPKRSSSLLTRRRESPLNGMTPLQTANLKRRSVDASVCLATAQPQTNSVLPSTRKALPAARFLQEALPIYPALRADTPPPSDQDDNYSPTTPPPDLHKCLPPAPLLSQPTPDPSPQMMPIRDSLLSEPEYSMEVDLRSHLRTPSGEAIGLTSPRGIPLRKASSDSNLPSTPTISPIMSATTHGLVIEEPIPREFLTFGERDVVEGKRSLIPVPLTPAQAPPRHLPPSPPVPPPSARIPVPAPLSPSRAGIMPSSPLTGAPAALAAMEVARIAKKYDFDLVYVVNLWPNRIAHLHSRCVSAASSSPSSPTSCVSPVPWLSKSRSSATPRESVRAHPDHCNCTDDATSYTGKTSGMTSRLLTGYNLAQLQHPFRLSTVIHKKFLRAEGWTEFRQDDAKPEEFARGYACSFYTGYSPDGRRACSGYSNEQQGLQHQHTNSTGSSGAASKKKRRANRGIVFAAYRKARNDGGSISSGAAELSALRGEAETLVELLLDFHDAQRPTRDVGPLRRASEGSVVATNL